MREHTPHHKVLGPPGMDWKRTDKWSWGNWLAEFPERSPSHCSFGPQVDSWLVVFIKEKKHFFGGKYTHWVQRAI